MVTEGFVIENGVFKEYMRSLTRTHQPALASGTTVTLAASNSLSQLRSASLPSRFERPFRARSLRYGRPARAYGMDTPVFTT